MSGLPVTVPPPKDDDHDDVAWALRAASAQWKREAEEEAVEWVERAADTARGIGATGRAHELACLAADMSGQPRPAPPAAAAPPPPATAEALDEDDIEDLDIDVEIEMDDEVEEVTPEPEPEDDEDEVLIDDLSEAPPPRSLRNTSTAPRIDMLPPSLRPEPSGLSLDSDDDDVEFGELEFDDEAETNKVSVSEPPSAPDLGGVALQGGPEIPFSGETAAEYAQSTTTGPGAASNDHEAIEEELGVDLSLDGSGSGSGHAGVRASAAPTTESATAAPVPVLKVEKAPEDFSSVFPDEPSAPAKAPEDFSSVFPDEPSAPAKAPEDFSSVLPEAPAKNERPSISPSSMPPGAIPSDPSPIPGRTSVRPSYPPGAGDRQTSSELEPYALAPSAEMPPAQSAAPPIVEPPSRPSQAPPPQAMLEPEERPSSLPEVSPDAPRAPSVPPAPRTPSVAPSVPPAVASSAPEPDELDDMFAAISQPPPAPTGSSLPKEDAVSLAPPPLPVIEGSDVEEPMLVDDDAELVIEEEAELVDDDAEIVIEEEAAELVVEEEAPGQEVPAQVRAPALAAPAAPAAPAPAAPAASAPAPVAAATAAPGIEVEVGEDGEIVIDEVDLFEIPGLQDIPEEELLVLARGAELKTLQPNEEVTAFAVALVTSGSVQMMPTIADAPCAVARKGEVLFTKGTIAESTAVRAVGAEPDTRVVLFSQTEMEKALGSCPWVADELAQVADRYLAFAGAVLGALGDSLDDMFRFMVLEKCSVKKLGEGDMLAEGGKPMDGMYIVAAGSLEVLAEDGSVDDELGMGDFVFPETVLSASPASQSVRAAAGGALCLYADRMGAHELLATCPPFIELLAG